MGGGVSKKKADRMAMEAAMGPAMERVLYEIKIHAAVNIPKLDRLTQSDTYITLLLPTGNQQTSVKENTAAPIWKSHNRFFAVGPLQDIRCQVWDKDVVTKDDLVGEFTIPFKSGGENGAAMTGVMKKHFQVTLAAGVTQSETQQPCSVIVSAGVVVDYMQLRKRVVGNKGVKWNDSAEQIMVPLPLSAGSLLVVEYAKADGGKKLRLKIQQPPQPTVDANKTCLMLQYPPQQQHPILFNYRVSKQVNKGNSVVSLGADDHVKLWWNLTDLMVVGTAEEHIKTCPLSELLGGAQQSIMPYSLFKSQPAVNDIAFIDDKEETTPTTSTTTTTTTTTTPPAQPIMKGTVVLPQAKEGGMLMMKWNEKGAKMDVDEWTWGVDVSTYEAGKLTYPSVAGGVKKVTWKFNCVPKAVAPLSTLLVAVNVSCEPMATTKSADVPITLNGYQGLNQLAGALKVCTLAPLLP